jgi:hypothetical protein
MDSQCPTGRATLGRMKTEKKFCRVTLEPELQEIAALWPAAKRFEVAHKLKRWAKQLKISAAIMASDGRAAQAPRPTSVPVLARRKAGLN